MGADTFDRLEITSAEALWRWLEDNCDNDYSLWLVTYKKSAGANYVSREAVLDALIAFGWIDGRRKVLDDQRTMQMIGPRRRKEWAESYCRRAERLLAEGRMSPRGEAEVAAAKARGDWRAMADVDALIVPDDLARVLDNFGGSRAAWDGLAPSYRRNVLRWIATAKRADTRARRVAVVADSVARSTRLAHL